MTKEQQNCGFCLNPVENPEGDDAGFIKFPDGTTRLCHLTHPGVAKEWDLQHGK